MANGKFVSYLRVSTGRQGKSGLGLEAQRQAVDAYLNGGEWQLVEEFVEVESGRSSERPKLEAALQLCRAHRAALASRWMSWGFDGERLTTAIKFLGTQGVQAR